MMNNTLTCVDMRFKKETKHTFVFESTDPEAHITTLYINKAAFKNGLRKRIECVIGVTALED
jgi:hypothetical protein